MCTAAISISSLAISICTDANPSGSGAWSLVEAGLKRKDPGLEGCGVKQFIEPQHVGV